VIVTCCGTGNKLAAITADNCELPTRDVERWVLFHLIADLLVNPVPLTTKVKLGPPAIATGGFSLEIVCALASGNRKMAANTEPRAIFDRIALTFLLMLRTSSNLSFDDIRIWRQSKT
jgi:hypothetical protein